MHHVSLEQQGDQSPPVTCLGQAHLAWAAYLEVATGVHAELQMESAREHALSCCLLQHISKHVLAG